VYVIFSLPLLLFAFYTMGVRQRPTRTGLPTTSSSSSSSPPSSSAFEIQTSSSSSSSSSSPTTQQRDQEEHSTPLLFTINLENDCNSANQQYHKHVELPPPGRSSSSSGGSCSSSFRKSDSRESGHRSSGVVVMPVHHQNTSTTNTTRTTSTGTNTTTTTNSSMKLFSSRNKGPSPRTNQRKGSTMPAALRPPLHRQQQRLVRRPRPFFNSFPSVSLLALFIMLASGCFFFNMMMVLVPPMQHLLSASSTAVSDASIATPSTSNTMDVEQQRRRSDFVMLPSSYHSTKTSSNNRRTNAAAPQLRRNSNKSGPYYARVVYSIYNNNDDNNNNKNQADTDQWSVNPPPPHDNTSDELFSRRATVMVDDEFMRVTESIQPIPSNDGHVENEEDCIPMADWQTASYPNCNSFHEIDLPTSINAAGGRGGGGGSNHKDTSTSNATTVARSSSSLLSEDVFRALAEGWFRTTWQWNRLNVVASNATTTPTQRHHQREEESVVIKTLRIEREFLWEYYDLHNRDAVAIERLTFSPYVVNVYGYCGQSAINEFADFPVPDMNILEKMNRRLRGFNDHRTSILKLHVAARIATGLAHVHAAGQVSSSPSSLSPPQPSMVHYDLNPKNVAIFRGGRPKIVRVTYIV
jgi:hypothetical protein